MSIMPTVHMLADKQVSFDNHQCNKIFKNNSIGIIDGVRGDGVGMRFVPIMPA